LPGVTRSDSLLEMPVPDIDAWLNGHLPVANSLVWNFPITVPFKPKFKLQVTDPAPPLSKTAQWPAWPASAKQSLRDTFAFYWQWNETFWPWYQKWADGNFKGKPGFNPTLSTVADADPSPVVDPPKNLNAEPTGMSWTVVGSTQAFNLYVKHVAMMLALEIGKHVPWSVLTYDVNGRSELFNGRQMFDWIDKGVSQFGTVAKAGHRLTTLVVPAPPLITMSFLALNGLIGSTPIETIERMLNWCRANLWHVSGGDIASPMDFGDLYWQYNGRPPVSRIINGTKMLEQVGNAFFPELHHWIAGCSGTSGFIKEVLRPVNIPVDVVIIGGHWTPHFINEHKYLSHGDDPYALAPEIPIGELPIDQATYDAWFVNNPNPLHNVGRRVMELTIQYLPKQLLWEYCLDGVQSNDHASGRVYNNNFAPGYTVAELEAMQLWEKLAAKVAALGGCGNIL